VALPAYSCYDLATAADGAGAEVVLYDVDPATLGPDWESLREALRRGAIAVVVAHLYGVPVDVPAVGRLAAEAGAGMIEDAAQGAGGELSERPLGGFGPLTVLSFGRGKGLTGGSGGALLGLDPPSVAVCSDAAGRLSRRTRGLRAVVGAAAQVVMARPALYWLPASIPWLRLGATVYRRPHPPRAMSPASVAILDRSWEASLLAVQGRRERAAQWCAAVPGGWRLPVAPPGSRPGWLRFPAVAPSAEAAQLDDLALSLGIAPGYPLSLADLGGFTARVANREAAFPGARELASRLVTLPTHDLLSDRDVAGALRWLSSTGSR
jgi:dTDP-4-amino-4,6-dideoxygalactose transaminase